MIRFKCQRCGSVQSGSFASMGQLVKCSACAKRTLVPSPGKDQVDFKCLNCGSPKFQRDSDECEVCGESSFSETCLRHQEKLQNGICVECISEYNLAFEGRAVPSKAASPQKPSGPPPLPASRSAPPDRPSSPPGHDSSAHGWEYVDYVMDLTENSSYGTIGTEVSLEDIKSHWWMQIRPIVLQQLQDYFNRGWELVTNIGPDCLAVDTRDRIGLFGSSIDVYPIEVRVQLRRRVGSA